MMRIPVILSAIATLSLAPAALADDDPYAPAKAGKLGCFAPDSEKKTCVDISTYSFGDNGNVTMEGESAISENPLITVRSKSMATKEGSNLCFVVPEGYGEGHIFLKDGKPMSVQESNSYRENEASRYAQLVNRKICLDISPYGSVFIAQISIDGTPLPAATNRMKWISADEGYVLAP
jgi:hypothetical protein